MGRSLIDALDITVPEGVVDYIDDAGGRRIWERCELRALTGDGEVAAKAGVRRGCVTMVGGKTFKWNQLIGTEGRTTGMSGARATKDSTGLFTFSGTATASAFTWLVQNTNAISGHWYFTGTDADIYVSNGTTSARNFYVRQITSTTAYVGIYTTQGREYNTSGRFWLCDMTDTFGAGNEPTTVDAAIAAYKLLGIDITQPQEYDAGSIRSAVPEAISNERRNLCPDTGWKIGTVVATTGAVVEREAPSNSAFSPYFEIPRDDVTYYCRSAYPASGTLAHHYYAFCYGDNYVFLGRCETPRYIRNTQFTVIPGTKYLRILNYASNDNYTLEELLPCCINKSDKYDGVYTPYNNRPATTRPIPDAVKALPGYGWSAGTAYNSIYREVDRWYYRQEVGSVDLGTLSWRQYTADTSERSFYAATDAMRVDNNNYKINALCIGYSAEVFGAINHWTEYDKAICGVKSPYRIIIRDTAYTSLSDFATGISGKMLYYELATPIITDITDITDMMTGYDWEYMVEGDRYEVTEPSGIQVPMEAAYFVRHGTAAWVSTPSLMMDMDQMELTGGAPENFEEV